MSHSVKDREQLQHALAVVLDHVRANDGKAYQEADLIHGIVMHFGNDANLWGPLLSLPDVPAIARVPGRHGELPTVVSFHGMRDIDLLHSRFKNSLHEIVAGRVTAATKNWAAGGTRRVVQVGSYYLPENLSAGLAFVVDLFIDQTKPYAADLRSCKLADCPRFFFVSIWPREPGKERIGALPEYCCPAHTKKAHNAIKSKWTQDRRKELKRIAAEGKPKMKRNPSK